MAADGGGVGTRAFIIARESSSAASRPATIFTDAYLFSSPAFVYEAIDRERGTRVALKTLHRFDAAQRRSRVSIPTWRRTGQPTLGQRGREAVRAAAPPYASPLERNAVCFAAMLGRVMGAMVAMGCVTACGGLHTPPSARGSDVPSSATSTDEAYFYLGYEYERGGDAAKARRAYLDLITKVPNSKYVPNAYLALGEMYFSEATTDPNKWTLAKEAYEQVVARPPPAKAVYGYAWYKLAYVFWNEGDFSHALAAFKNTLDFAVAYPQLSGATTLAQSARTELIAVYALTGSPTDAYDFFKSGLTGDEQASDRETFARLNELGQRYMEAADFTKAVDLYRDLLTRDGYGEKAPEYEAQLAKAVRRASSLPAAHATP